MKLEIKKFGWVVGGIFFLYAILKALMHLREPIPLAAIVTGSLGFFLILSAFLELAVLNPLYAGWMKIGGVLGKINATILLGIIFFLILTPLGLLRRLLRQTDPRFAGKENKDSYWIHRTTGEGKQSLNRPF